eukprot:6202455-Pleurochrysis_carterae.AAC.4
MFSIFERQRAQLSLGNRIRTLAANRLTQESTYGNPISTIAFPNRHVVVLSSLLFCVLVLLLALLHRPLTSSWVSNYFLPPGSEAAVAQLSSRLSCNLQQCDFNVICNCKCKQVAGRHAINGILFCIYICHAQHCNVH